MMRLHVIGAIIGAVLAAVTCKMTLHEKFLKAQSTSKDFVFELGYADFNQLTAAAQSRPFSTIVMFTAMSPKRKCSVCHEAQQVFATVAKSAHMQYNGRVFFAKVDFDSDDRIQTVFKRCSVDSVPMFLHIAPDHVDLTDKYLDFPVKENLVQWINERANVKIEVSAIPNSSVFVLGLALFGMLTCCFYIRRSMFNFLFQRRFWACGCVIFCLFMSSGQMWNQIRNAPLMNPKSYIHGSSQGQYVIESLLIFVIYGTITCAMIMLIEASKEDTDRGNNGGNSLNKRSSLILGLILLSVVFSYLITIFRAKIHGYPFGLFL